MQGIAIPALTGERRDLDAPLVTKDGALVPASIRLRKGAYEGEECVLAFCEPRIAEQEASQYFEVLFTHAPMPMSLRRVSDRVFTEVNDAFLAFTGHRRNEVIGRTLFELSLIPDSTAYEAASNLFRKTGRLSNHELAIRRKDGSIGYGLFSGEVISLKGVAYSLVTMVDISEIRRANTLLSAVLDGTPDIIFYKDLDGRYFRCNAEFARHVGRTPEEIVGKTDYDLYDHAEAETYRVNDRLMLECGLPRHNEEWVSYPDGRRVLLDTLKSPLRGPGGEVIGVIGLSRDITELKRLEEERLEMERRVLHTQKLESLGVLAGGIAHDFDNLLMSILGHADLALDELPPTAPARSNIEQIGAASKRAAELCRQMLAYSGRGRFVIERLDAGALIEEMAHLLHTSISKKAHLNLRLESGLPAIEADATQIRQIIMNLVINASEAIGEDGGVIAISTGVVSSSADRRAALSGGVVEGEMPQEGAVWIEVADTGSGMDQSTMDRLFEPFFTTKFTGRGLGMSAVLGIVRGHRGALTVSSEVGTGSTFRVFLPAVAGGAEPAAPEAAGVAVGPVQGRILLVDDEESIRTLGRRILERIGFTVITAVDGREALEVYKRERPPIDLVILDLTMPNLDGEEALVELRKIDPAVRVVMASGFGSHEIENRFSEKRIHGALQKPYTMAELRAVLSPVFDDLSRPVDRLRKRGEHIRRSDESGDSH